MAREFETEDGYTGFEIAPGHWAVEHVNGVLYSEDPPTDGEVREFADRRDSFRPTPLDGAVCRARAARAEEAEAYLLGNVDVDGVIDEAACGVVGELAPGCTDATSLALAMGMALHDMVPRAECRAMLSLYPLLDDLMESDPGCPFAYAEMEEAAAGYIHLLEDYSVGVEIEKALEARLAVEADEYGADH